ncbi:hypothetical protein ABZY06_33785 [Streptomyces sp. NPDC006540]|uniref:hypothetical protein n=1 Tax=Streptomyces sp. NPDC006540 TaxID=3155353 RepID=UPI0033BF0675
MTQRYNTFDGGTIDVETRGALVDLHLRNAAGRTVATVEMTEDDAARLIANLGGSDEDALEEAYQDGYRDGEEAAA